MEKTYTFPAKLQDIGRIAIPLVIRQMLEVDKGDIVLVKISRVEKEEENL